MQSTCAALQRNNACATAIRIVIYRPGYKLLRVPKSGLLQSFLIPSNQVPHSNSHTSSKSWYSIYLNELLFAHTGGRYWLLWQPKEKSSFQKLQFEA